MEQNQDIELLREVSGELPAVIKTAPLLLVVPSLLLAGGAAMDAWVSSLHSVMPAVVGVLKGIGWGLYVRFAMRSAGGVENPGYGTPMVLMALAFLALEYGGWGLLVGAIVWLMPVVDYAVMYGEGPDVALGGVLDTLKSSAVVWLGTMIVLLLVLFMLGLVFSLPMSVFSDYAHREGAWLVDLVGGALVGPLVHVAILYRARLFLALHGDPA
ncbi:MAG: hypothetical protein DI536_12205 [Archangium gephyra]|uniref:Uncharacterized protein n=1 Tax=Archangium gephyra TaxID=48 RepID=A0A2W5TL46_9BACT|nr:MAG: hypothetical protein DI536_12205 [Archangium gephyra]